MADEVDIAGKKFSKNQLLAFSAVAVLVVIYAAYRKQSAAKSAAASAPSPSTAAASPGYSNDSYPPDGTTGNPIDPYSTDPTTGQTYGDEQIGYSGANSAGYIGGGSSPYSGGSGYPLNYATATSGSIPTFTSNAQWSQFAENYMVGTLGMDAQTVGNALGKYLTGQPVTSDQQSIIQQAIAFAGQPPQAGSGGFPPSINLQASSTGTVTPPSVTTPPGSVGVTGWYLYNTTLYVYVQNGKVMWLKSGPNSPYPVDGAGSDTPVPGSMNSNREFGNLLNNGWTQVAIAQVNAYGIPVVPVGRPNGTTAPTSYV